VDVDLVELKISAQAVEDTSRGEDWNLFFDMLENHWK
jgi:hypothetical protein